jgi:hypothetical protein
LDTASTEHILNFLKRMEVGNRMKEKEREQGDEVRDELYGWMELMDHPWEEEEGLEVDHDEEELLAWNSDTQGHVTIEGGRQ